MSNPLRSSSMDAQTTEPLADDLDEPPPPFSRGRTHFNNGPSSVAGRRGGQFSLSRRHSQQLSAKCRSQINQHQQGHSGDSSSTKKAARLLFIHLPQILTLNINTNTNTNTTITRPSPMIIIHNPAGSSNNNNITPKRPYIQPQHQNHSHPNPPQQQLQHHFSYTSPPESHQSASLTSSTSDSSSFLRHPHDPKLLQAQYQATASSFDLAPDPNFTPNASDLVPIQLQGSVTAHTHIPQPQPPPFVGFPAPGPAGPAAAPFIHAGDDSDFFHPHPHPHPHPHHHHHHRQNGVLQFPGGYPISFMQNPELSILNAESFDDGVPGFHAPRSLPPAGRSRVAGEESGKSRKRAKTQAVDTCEQEEEEKKRSRGRPRLDTNDETAKDRRRTQIRLAQRAYRNRKETAIQTLEKKVDQLRSNNEEMSKAFMKLYDFAVGKGMLETAPEFGKQLQATTEKFYSLARGTSDDGGKDVDMTAAPDHGSEGHRSSPNSNPDKPSEKSPSPDRAQPGTQADQVLYGGYMVDHTSSLARHHPHQSHALTAVHTTSWAHNNQALQARTIASQAPLGYEIVTEPTPDNASFPFGMSLEGSGLDTAGLLDSSGQPLSFSESPYSLLSAPSSYAYQERTFGRRLQRSTLERAYVLMRMPNPPPNRIASVFGFCMLFESREKIVERLANRLSVNQRETLFNWRFPFLHLGGGGTFFDEMRNEMDASDLPRHDKSLRTTQAQVGNQGSLEPERQKIDSMYGIGPWNAQTEEIRDARVDHKLRMSVPGFDGDFYDADEVEWSLRQRGVVIPPAADFVTAEINPADFTDEAIAERSFNPLVDNYIATTMAESNFNMAAPFGDNPQSQSTGQPVNLEATGTPTLDFMGTTAQGAPSTISMENPMSLDPTLGGDLFGLGASTPSQVPTPASTRRTVTINVGMLVHELGSRSVCLGRSPGIRPKDVNAAFWSSLAA
ncbi:hypothetical protein CGCTS75_v014708 [Colletotrichum tropicale]|nr:hypothetical protein CGCTS75_v014708 [Colletotrichum tropicale]